VVDRGVRREVRPDLRFDQSYQGRVVGMLRGPWSDRQVFELMNRFCAW